MKVKAIATGFYGGARYREGAVFEVKNGDKAKWFVPVNEAPVGGSKKADTKKQPETFSELNKVQEQQEKPKGIDNLQAE